MMHCINPTILGQYSSEAVQGVRFEIAVSLLQNSDLLVGWRENTF